MDSAVDAETPLGAWAWIRGYFTPATLFLVVNLVIGTIALTSRAAAAGRSTTTTTTPTATTSTNHRCTRRWSSSPGTAATTTTRSRRCTRHRRRPRPRRSRARPLFSTGSGRSASTASAPLQRTPSVLDRLHSFGLYGFLAPDQPATAAAVELMAKSLMAKSSSEARQTPAPRPAEASGECVNARAEAFIDNFRQQQQQQGVVHHYQEPEEEYVPPPAPLSRAPSVLDRLRSFSLYRFRSGDLGPDLPSAAAETDENKEAAHYGRSRSEPAREQGKKKKQQQEARMSKSSSSGAVEEETEQCVDARADDFINKFRQQLQLQRLNSLLNYKEMLGGGKQA